MRPTEAIIDLSAIRQNVAAFKKLISPSEVCTVVKADGYGHGDVPVATAALDAGATRLAVALVEEGVRLREAGISAPILVLAQPSLRDAAEFIEWELTPSVYTEEFVEALGSAGGRGLGVHLKVDTGMHRVGVAPERLEPLLKAIRSADLEIEGIFTHFPVADSDTEFTNRQIDIFQQLVEPIDGALVHMANTAGAILFPDSRADLARIGLGTYGLYPSDPSRNVIDLLPAMSVVSEVAHVQRLPAGTRLSYGRTRALDGDATVVTVPIGYADGFWRLRSGSGSAIIGGQQVPLGGTVTMDQTMFVVGDAEVTVGDTVTLLGSNDGLTISADDWANTVGTISYEIVCSIGSRIPRKYIT